MSKEIKDDKAPNLNDRRCGKVTRNVAKEINNTNTIKHFRKLKHYA
jgi:hypothetical protein